MRHIHTAFPLMLASLCLTLFVILSAQAAEQETVPLTTGLSGKAPAFTYLDEKGREQTLDASKARLTAVHFWATWCIPCVDELPQVDDTQDIYGKNLQIIPIALDGKNAEKVKAFYQEQKIEHLPVLTDPSNKLPQAAGLKGLPGTLFIDRKGNIVARASGPLDWQQEQVVAFIKGQLK